jgi:hypothetical protein
MHSQVRTWAIAVGAAILCAATASAQNFNDSFETSSGHPAGNGAGVTFTPSGTGANGWRQWDGAANNDSKLYNNSGPTTAHTGTQYIGTQLASDSIHEWSTYTSGHWVISTWTYVPGPASTQPMQDSQWWIVLNEYNDFGPYTWATQVNFDPVFGQVLPDNGIGQTSCTPQYGSGPALTYDAWKEVKADVDLATDLATVFYDGAQIGEPFSWSQGPFGQNGGAGLPCPPPVFGIPAIDCIDLYANSTTFTPSFMFWDDVKVEAAGGATPPAPYCTPSGPTTNGCIPGISATTAPNVAHTSGCVVTVNNVEGQKNGIIFYGVASNAVPWCATGGNSMLCVKSPTARTGNQGSGGTAGACNGTLVLNWDAFQIANPGSLGQPWSAGNHAYVQGWFRDPPACKTTFLSTALDMTYAP